jgi:hypothetical protein
MFGHDNHHEENNLPEPDGALTGDHGTSTAPQVDDTGAGSYIDDVPAAAPAINVVHAHDPTGPAPADDAGQAAAPVAAAPDDNAAPASAAPVAAPDTDTLLDIKQQALQQLTPLVGHLEQNPEEKFRTTMMMIQASDNHELVATAYEAAQQIADEKARAQALLDIVNEINYFTHNSADA